jgi:hypothetical protein
LGGRKRGKSEINMEEYYRHLKLTIGRQEEGEE